jgi:hypothetical protein
LVTRGKKTLVETELFKISTGKRLKELYTLGKIFLGMFLILAIIGAFQVGICKGEHPKKTVWECIAPARAGK